jgi:hypothetical protein
MFIIFVMDQCLHFERQLNAGNVIFPAVNRHPIYCSLMIKAKNCGIDGLFMNLNDLFDQLWLLYIMSLKRTYVSGKD